MPTNQPQMAVQRPAKKFPKTDPSSNRSDCEYVSASLDPDPGPAGLDLATLI